MKIIRCLVNHLCEPMGYRMRDVAFSFVVQGAAAQEARLCVWDDAERVVYDSGWTRAFDPLAWKVPLALKARTRYAYTIAARAEDGAEAVSERCFFETGLMDEAWQAHWITCDKGERLPVFHKTLPQVADMIKARLYICGLGMYEARIGGERVGDEYLAPYCTNYEAWVQYQTYDVTELLRKSGELSVLVGPGWYASRFGFNSRAGQSGYYGNDYKLIAQVVITRADGSEMVVGTDESWQVTRSRLTFSGIYDGEHRDDTLPDTAPEACALAEAPQCALTERLSLPVKVQETWHPVAMLHTPAGETVLDMGQNFAGIFRLRVHVSKGRAVRVQVGEVMQNDCFYRDNLRSAKAEYVYVSDGNEHVLQPCFTFYGYRYVKIEGVDQLQADDFTALALYSDLPLRGSVETGHAKLNQLISNAHWGLRSNFLDVPTDCPQRDERMGWTGDAQVFSPTACYFRDGYAFYTKYLRDMATEQAALSGSVPNVIPSFGYHDTATVWGDATCIIPWNMYRMYGDAAILAEHYDAMKAWVDYIRRLDGDTHHWREVFHYGDWLALDHPAGGEDQVFGGTDVGYIADVYYANSALLVAKAAALLGKAADKEAYTALHDRILQDVQNEFFTPTGRLAIDTQTGLVLALRYPGVAPSRDRMIAQLRHKFMLTGPKLQTGFVGTPLLCGTLCDIGESRLAYDLLLREEYPGWLYQVNLGATTVWERWNSLSPDGSVSSTGMNSFNHYAYGSIIQWLFEYAAGLQPLEDAPGYRRVTIAPRVDARLGHIDMRYQSASGDYRVYWEMPDDKHLTLRVEIPAGCEAMLTLPPLAESEAAAHADNPMLARPENGAFLLYAGRYELTCALA